ncbi:hypothetical protein NL676_013285 [Syzygium grande]|nr:hypothetical protein NL676_013285 [Syzygium grande]
MKAKFPRTRLNPHTGNGNISFLPGSLAAELSSSVAQILRHLHIGARNHFAAEYRIEEFYGAMKPDHWF